MSKMLPMSWLRQSIITVLCVLGIPSYLSAPKPISISLEGRASVSVPATRAIVALDVYAEGPRQDKVADDVRRTTDEMLALMRPLTELRAVEGAGSTTGPNCTTVVVDQSGGGGGGGGGGGCGGGGGEQESPAIVTLSVNTFRSHSYQKPNLLLGQAPVYEARAEIEAEFRAFDALGELLAQVTKTPGVSVTSLRWTLDAATRRRMVAECREQATADALDKVRAYVRPFGMDKVRAIRIAETGRSSSSSSSRGLVFADAWSSRVMHDELDGGAGGDENQRDVFGLEPRSLEIVAEIEGDFCAWRTGLEAWFRRGGV